MTKKERYEGVLAYFEEHMPEPQTELNYQNPYQLLVAVILSAQCTDKRVNMVTPDLFAAFPTIDKLAASEDYEVYEYIKSISYPNNKARHLVGMARMVNTEFGGQIPMTVPELIRLPGVGRKTANVITSVLDQQPNMAVDTHVFRVSARIGLTTAAKTVLQAEQQLIRYIPQAKIHKAHHWLILHGRYTCIARKPLCHQCGITVYCRFFAKNSSKINTR
ncbi:MAG: endonuclease III [Taibaiella sp.]|nr:endonuclease III [Taibaiella sp.]